MTVLTDSRGVPQLVGRPSDMAGVESAIVQLVSMKLDHERCRPTAQPAPPVALQLMLALDLLCSMERPAVMEAAEICAAITKTEPTEARTRAMLSAVEFWTAGDLTAARNGFQAIVDTYPGDAVSVFVVHMLDFYIGDRAHMLASISQAVGFFADDDPAIGYLHGLHAFSLEENGLIDAAMERCRVALDRNPDDIYAMHAMVHCLYETGRHEEGARYIREYMRSRDGSTPMRIHIWWHYALFELYADNIQEVLACYRIGIRRKTSPRSTEDLDAVTMLWRLALIKPSLDLDAYWRSLFQDWEPYLEENWYLFNDFHAYITYCQVGEYDRADALLKAVLARGTDVSEEMVDIFLGFRSFTTGDYADAATRLARSFHHSFSMGGSNAQRDVVELTGIEAAIRAQNYELVQRIRETGRVFRHQSAVLQEYKNRLAALRTSAIHA
ncbi:hypothetical protein ACH4OW_28775 [Streptomyces sp. NPDC017056]|uniref:hypothetical protein n=1 Tax=Streptomyces sp. NPDC017056 TaxID=3364973 RepID=UPI0037B96D95